MPAPLRKIVEEKVKSLRTPSGATYTVEVEVLECGHTIRRKVDIIGPTNAYRRRCRKCAAAQSN